MERKITQTPTGLRIQLGASKPRRRSCRHKWYVNNGVTACGLCGKPYQPGN